jgi:hypothetical protein
MGNPKGIGSAAVVLGLSDFGIELIDSWARWDMLAHIPYLDWATSKFVAPILIFIGMFLILRAREKEHQTEIETVKKVPTLVDVNSRPAELPAPKRRSPWRLLLLIPIAAPVAFIGALIVLCFYVPPKPEPTFWTHLTPIVDPLAYVGFSEARQLCAPRTSIEQTLVEGQVVGSNISGNTQIATLDGPPKQTGMRVEAPGVTFKDSTMCFGPTWECIVMEQRLNLEKRNIAKFEEEVRVVNQVIGLRTFGHALERDLCTQQAAKAFSILRKNTQDESKVYQYLVAATPDCLKQP